ncbi:MAG: hypothetical protein LBE27_05555 [Deltaproteobacteria bacterium]|jgi:hypothetical protein|nr:hypothetical protein [Deltaproteobacteria bacterium]
MAHTAKQTPNEIKTYDSVTLPKNTALHFGDIWLMDQMIKRVAFDKILERAIPKYGDTLKALLGYRIIANDEYALAKDWYDHSYAQFLYPRAKLDIKNIAKCLSTLGSISVFQYFYSTYLETITTNPRYKKTHKLTYHHRQHRPA